MTPCCYGQMCCLLAGTRLARLISKYSNKITDTCILFSLLSAHITDNPEFKSQDVPSYHAAIRYSIFCYGVGCKRPNDSPDGNVSTLPIFATQKAWQ